MGATSLNEINNQDLGLTYFAKSIIDLIVGFSVLTNHAV